MNVYLQAYLPLSEQWIFYIVRIVTPILFHPTKISAAPILKANASAMPDAEKPAGEAASCTTLTIKSDNKTETIRFQEVIWLQSDNHFVTIQTTNETYVQYRSLRSIEQELDKQQFVRIHRSAIVNRTFIQSISQLPNGDGYVQLTTGEELRYSRNFKKELVLE